jgi:hypothetical protein
LFDIGTGSNLVRDSFILLVVAFELIAIYRVNNRLSTTAIATRLRLGGEDMTTNLFQLFHEVGCIKLNLIIGIMKASLNYLVHNMKVA